MDNLADDPGFIDAIVHEVKSQGLFDQFRKECLADVDTKPAYQNLRQRVESSVSKFLSQQKWIDNIRHKNQLREKLRKNIIESGFLEMGVERIVDQVVNPKISTVFHPKVEDIMYNYLGIEKPKPIANGSGGMEVQTDSLLLEDLEAVSPDSDKKSSSASSDIHPTIERHLHEELNEPKENIDEFDSPAFEPLQTRPPSQTKHESNDSNASAISGLTSQESVENEPNGPHYLATESVSGEVIFKTANKQQVKKLDDEPINAEMAACISIKTSLDVAQNDSQLSQVSSNSRLSIITNSECVIQQQQQRNTLGSPRLDITEEAQMPKFNDNSNEEEGELPDSYAEAPGADCELKPQKSNFDLKQEAYDFKGTDRNIYVDTSLKDAVRENTTEKPYSGTNEGATKDESMNISLEEQDQNASPPLSAVRFEENSSHSERSLRICEDSTLEQKTLDTSDRLENCDSAKTPLNDEHSTQSAPDVDKMDSSQVEIIVSLAAVQQHVSEKDSRKDRHNGRDQNSDRGHSSSHRYGSSSSRDDRKSHGSSKQCGNSSSSRRSERDRDKKNEYENINSNSGSSRKTHNKKKNDDDHYSSHEKPAKRRRSTDRDSNDGAENGKCTNVIGLGSIGSKEFTHAKDSQTTDKQGDGTKNTQNQLNDSLDSSFEGFDEHQLHHKPKRMHNIVKVLTKSPDKSRTEKKTTVKRYKNPNHKSPKDTDHKNLSNMDVFAFSFDKPAKLGKNVNYDESRNYEQKIESLDEGIIVLEPTELAKVIQANKQHDVQDKASDLVDEDKTLQTESHLFSMTNPNEIVTLATQPVIVDQILTSGDNMDLELLIGEKQLHGDETTLDKIQQGLDVAKNRVRKPKIASNFNEARKLMKVRRLIEREEKKKREQAMALAKKLITDNGNEEDQGIELEFVCDSNRNSSRPIISSPVRQKATKRNGSLEEELDLLYLPEDNQIYAEEEKLMKFLKQKTKNVSVPEHFKQLDCRLYSLDSSQRRKKNVRNTFLDIDDGEKMAITVVKSWDDPSVAKPDTINNQQDNIVQESPIFSKLRGNSCDIEHSVEQVLNEVEKAVTPKSRFSKRKYSRSSHNVAAITDVDFEACFPVRRIKRGTSKIAIITVDISETINVDKGSPGNNNNGVINAQRYSSDDLYKPRHNSRTRTRASEQIGI